MKALLFAVVMLASCHHAHAEVTEKDELFLAGMALHTVDYMQTMGISKSCHNGGKYYETNPVLGKCPSASKVGKYFLATSALMAVVHYQFKTNVPVYAWIAVEAGATANNARIGVSMRF